MHVTLELQSNEVLGLIGPNGAGKSTLVNVLSGFDTPDAGTIVLDGRDITRWRADRRAPQRLGPHVPAEPRVPRALGPREHRGRRARRRHLRCAMLADVRTSCSGCCGCCLTGSGAADALAHGDERRLGVGRALATVPRFVLMDEPAAGLTEAEASEFAAVIRAVRDEHGAGVLLIDHNMALIMDVCDRIQVLDQGRMLAEGTPEEIREKPGRRRGIPGRECGARGRSVTPMLEVEALDIRYGGVAAVRAVSLTVQAGEIVGLIGPNGAGKSSTLNAIVGAVPIAGGDVRVAGRSIRGARPEDVARSRRRSRSGGSPDLRRAHGGGEPPARARWAE